METPITTDQRRTEAGIPSESTHWYAKDGSPCYQVEAKKGGLRDTTLADARKLDLVPSVTAILNIAAKPGLEVWKSDQLLDSALTLPMMPYELADDYKKRVILDAGEKSKKAREKGTELHAAIEEVIRTGQCGLTWGTHVLAVIETLKQHGIDILESGKAEHSFASSLGYGGKIDFHNDELIIIDFKTTEHLNKNQLVWPEHVQQLAAYGVGVFGILSKFRALNVFVGISDKQVRIAEHTWDDLVDGFGQFECLLSYWNRTKKFGQYAKVK